MLAVARTLREVGFRLLQAAVDPAADAGLRADGFAGRATGVDRREVLVVDGLRRPSGERADARRDARQRDDVLGSPRRRRRRRGCTGRASTVRASRPRRIADRASRRFPRRYIRAPRQWCEPTVQHHALDRHATRRSLRRVRTTRAVRRGRAHVLRDRPLILERCGGVMVHRARGERTIEASQERVFDWLADPANLTAAPLVLRAGFARARRDPAWVPCGRSPGPACGSARRSRPTTRREATPTG